MSRVITDASRQGSQQQVWQLGAGNRPHSLNYSEEQKEQTGSGERLYNLKVNSQWHTSSSNAVPSKPVRTAPSTGNQVFKYLSLWGHFLFKPPQGSIRQDRRTYLMCETLLLVSLGGNHWRISVCINEDQCRGRFTLSVGGLCLLKWL